MFGDKNLWIISVVVAAIGALDSLYLAWSKLFNQPVFCGPYGGCETVNSSRYAEVGGIPIAILGLGAYLLILVFLLLENSDGMWREYSPYLVFGISLGGFLYSIYLTYLELAVIHSICLYCVLSAIAITILFILSIPRLLRPQAETYPN